MSGLPASGKSTLAKTALSSAPNCVISYDDYRNTFMGSCTKQIDGKSNTYLYGWEQGHGPFFDIIDKIIHLRANNKLPTIVDAQNLTDSDRKDIIKIANKYGMKSEILLVDTPVDVCLKNDLLRSTSVGADLIKDNDAKLARTSAYPYKIVKMGDDLEFKPLTLDTNIDVIGDVHGLKNELFALLTKAGYSFDKNEIPSHPENRKLLFLGDVVDRGPQSVELVEWLYKIRHGGHLSLIGNHELKLLAHVEGHKVADLKLKSPSSAETFHSFLKLPEEVQDNLFDFVKSWPSRLVLSDGKHHIGCVHADLFDFDPINTPSNVCAYGHRKSEDTDKLYNDNYLNGGVKYTLLRGHIPNTGAPQEYVFSLEERQAFKGNLVLLPVDKWLADYENTKSYRVSFENVVLREKSDFDFKEHDSNKRKLYYGLESLIKNKMAVKNEDKRYGLAIYNFSKRVFWDNLWDQDPLLFKARGLVLSADGQIVQHPFDKIFNYGENKTGFNLGDNAPVVASEKMNGFMGCITKHPYKNDLLITTKGSFDSDFVGYIKDLLTKEQRGKMIQYLLKNDETLIFEVLHPSDPHIVPYEEKDYGLWLIGARKKNFNSPMMTEVNLDILAPQIAVKRGKHFLTTLGHIKNLAKTDQTEGWVLRDPNSGELLLKIKSNFYLLTKFLGRMGDKNIQEMFGNPKNFKKKVEEEFEFIVDKITQNISREQFLSMTKEKRVEVVREMIEAHYSQNKQSVKP